MQKEARLRLYKRIKDKDGFLFSCQLMRVQSLNYYKSRLVIYRLKRAAKGNQLIINRKKYIQKRVDDWVNKVSLTNAWANQLTDHIFTLSNINE